jgi:integrase
MATITKRRGNWFAQVRRKGHEPLYQTFKAKADAQAWAREQEAVIDKGGIATSTSVLRNTTLGELVDRYVRLVTPQKRGAASERYRLNKMRQSNVCLTKLSDLSTSKLASYRDDRLAEVTPATVKREISLIHRILEVARLDWGIPIQRNPAADVRVKKADRARDRRLKAGELELLLQGAEMTRSPFLKPAILLAIETGLRRGELLMLSWSNIDFETRTAYIPHTKTDTPRTIPLTDQAIETLRAINRTSDDVFDVSPNTLRLAWERLRNKVGLSDLRFHDLRHEALSRFCELGLSIPELSLISGHKDPRMLFRYTHLRADDLANKLAGRSWEMEQKRIGRPSG